MTLKIPALIRVIYALCLIGATSTHVLTIATHGLFWDYEGAPIFARVFWTSLTFLDPLAAVLLFIRPRVGVSLAVAIIVTDVAHNTWLLSQSTEPNWRNWMYISQIVFLIFVLLTASRAWKVAPTARR